MYVCMYACMYIRTYTYIYIRIYTYIHVCIRIYRRATSVSSIYVHTRIYTYIHVYTRMYTYIQASDECVEYYRVVFSCFRHTYMRTYTPSGGGQMRSAPVCQRTHPPPHSQTEALLHHCIIHKNKKPIIYQVQCMSLLAYQAW